MLKKLDAETVAVILLCGALLISWNYIFGPNGLDWMPKQQTKTTVAPTADKQTPSLLSSTPPPTLEPKNTPPPSLTQETLSLSKPSVEKPAMPFTDMPDVKISNAVMDILINPSLGQISSIDLKNFLTRDKKHNVFLNKDASPGALSVTFPRLEFALIDANIESSDNKSLVLRRKFSMPDGTLLCLKQSWKISDNYVIAYSIDCLNESGKDIVIPEMLVCVGAMPPVKYLAGDSVLVSESHGIDRCMASNDAIIETRAVDGKFEERATQDNPVKWIGVSNKYFSCVLKPSLPFPDGNISKRISTTITPSQNGTKEEYFVVYTSGCVKNIVLPAHSAKTWDFSYYTGPKSILLLKEFDPQAPFIMHLAWRYIDTVSQWLLYGLIFLKNIAGSYGMAIILLTLIVKLVFWPITHKSNQSMKKMQKIQHVS